MRMLRWLRTLAVLLATAGLLVPEFVLHAEEPAGNAVARPTPGPAATWQVVDVSLGAQGELSGQLVDVAGVPLVGEEIKLTRDGKEVASLKTNAEGKFSVAGLRGGVFQVAAAGNVVIARAWTKQASPPGAKQGLLLVASGDAAVRANNGPTGELLTNPWVITGVLLIGVGVPVLMNANRNDRPPSS